MKYCKRCLYPDNHPLNLVFDDRGICSGCRVHEEKDELNWAKCLTKLKELVQPYKSQSRTIHDCVIPVSGARDSFFIVDFVKNQLGLHPLLVTYNKHYNTQVGIRNLAYLRSQIGLDLMTMTVSPDRVKKITRESIRRMGSIYWHCLAGQTAFPVQIAVKFKIPLIIWGAHQGVDQVGMFSHTDEVEMTRKYRKEHDLMGFEADTLLEGSKELKTKDMAQFQYPHDKELEAVGVRGIYLNNYVRWDTKAQHEKMLQKYGYETLPQQRTFDSYNDVDCFHYSGLHDYIKYLKWGYGKATDHATREIRLRRMTRKQGMELVQNYHEKKPADTQLFLDWLGMDEDEFWEHIDNFRDPEIWEHNMGNWTLKDSILHHADEPGVEDMALPLIDQPNVDFIDTGLKETTNRDNKYTLIGRGWVG